MASLFLCTYILYYTALLLYLRNKLTLVRRGGYEILFVKLKRNDIPLVQDEKNSFSILLIA